MLVFGQYGVGFFLVVLGEGRVFVLAVNVLQSLKIAVTSVLSTGQIANK